MTNLTDLPSTSLPSAWIDRLFARLDSLYGNRFRDMWKGSDVADVKAIWGAELVGYTAEEIRRGLESLRGKHPSWPPTLYEFTDLCRPGLTLSPEAAFHEAVRGVEERKQGRMGKWTARAVYWAMIDVSAFDVSSLTWPQIKSRWTVALESRSADQNLPEIPEPPKALPPPEVVKSGQSERLDALAAMVGDRLHPRAWIGKILERKANGDPTLSDYAYKMALEASR